MYAKVLSKNETFNAPFSIVSQSEMSDVYLAKIKWKPVQ